MSDPPSQWIATALTAADVAVSLVASAHVVLTKRDTKAAIGWIGLIWLSPLLGTGLYVVLGINRVRLRARGLRPRPTADAGDPADPPPGALGPDAGHLAPLARAAGRVTHRPLLAGNAVE